MLFVKEEEDGQIVSLGDSHVEGVHGCLAILSMFVVARSIASYIERLIT